MGTFPSPDLRIAPSLLSADFARLADEIREVEAAGADWLHVDVMDGHFVPNLTIGPPVVEAIARATSLPLDVHLMITDPWKYADAFLDAGASVLTFHAELDGDARGLAEKVRSRGGRAGVALNPDTPIERIETLLPHLDMVLVMSVFPGFGGQRFMPEVLEKVRRLRGELGFERDVEMDGGLDQETVPSCAAAGANVLVAGTSIFGRPDRAAALEALREAARAGREECLRAGREERR